MIGSVNRSLLRGAFYVGGAVATTAGLHTVVTGAKSLPGRQVANPSVESELRFYAAFYVAYGVAALSIAPRAERETGAVRALAGALLLAGLARAGGWLAAGTPHEVQRGLLHRAGRTAAARRLAGALGVERLTHLHNEVTRAARAIGRLSRRGPSDPSP